jgi:hypothetical protein
VVIHSTAFQLITDSLFYLERILETRKEMCFLSLEIKCGIGIRRCALFGVGANGTCHSEKLGISYSKWTMTALLHLKPLHRIRECARLSLEAVFLSKRYSSRVRQATYKEGHLFSIPTACGAEKLREFLDTVVIASASVNLVPADKSL